MLNEEISKIGSYFFCLFESIGKWILGTSCEDLRPNCKQFKKGVWMEAAKDSILSKFINIFVQLWN